MLIVWKGASSKIKLSDGEIAGAVLGVAGGVAIIVIVFFLPYLWRKVIHGDWTLKYWHIPQGPLLLKRGEVPPRPADVVDIQDYYAGHGSREDEHAAPSTSSDDIEKAPSESDRTDAASPDLKARPQPAPAVVSPSSKLPEGEWYQPSVLFYLAKRAFFHGVEQDVVSAQAKRDILSGNPEERNTHAAHYDNRAEYMYSFLQVMTAATASFTHGANDVSK